MFSTFSIIFVDVKAPMESWYMILIGFALVFAVVLVAAAVITYSKKFCQSANGTLQSLESMLVTMCRSGRHIPVHIAILAEL